MGISLLSGLLKGRNFVPAYNHHWLFDPEKLTLQLSGVASSALTIKVSPGQGTFKE